MRVRSRVERGSGDQYPVPAAYRSPSRPTPAIARASATASTARPGPGATWMLSTTARPLILQSGLGGVGSAPTALLLRRRRRLPALRPRRHDADRTRVRDRLPE